jgi:hypothetical protein
MVRKQRRSRLGRQVALAERIQRLALEVEKLVPLVRSALAGESATRAVFAAGARSLERAARAVRALADDGRPIPLPGAVSGILEGTSPLMSLLGSRVVLVRAGERAPARAPSIGAQALALLLEKPAALEASEVASRLGCSVPVARTTLNRLVQSGHAVRAGEGRFRARRR